MLSQPFPRTTTNPAGRASTIRSPSTTTRRGAPLSRAVASTTVRFAVSADTPRASMAQRAKAGLPPATVTVMPVGTLESGQATAISSLSGTRRMPPPTDSAARLQLVEQPVGFGRGQASGAARTPRASARGRARSRSEQPVAHRATQRLRPCRVVDLGDVALVVEPALRGVACGPRRGSTRGRAPPLLSPAGSRARPRALRRRRCRSARRRRRQRRPRARNRRQHQPSPGKLRYGRGCCLLLWPA